MTHTNVSPTSHTKSSESVLHAVNSLMFRVPSLFPIHYFMNFNQKWTGLLLCFYLSIYDCTSTWVKRDYQPICGYFYLSPARLSTNMRILLPESSEIINPHANPSTWVKRDYQPVRESLYLNQARLSTHTRIPAEAPCNERIRAVLASSTHVSNPCPSSLTASSSFPPRMPSGWFLRLLVTTAACEYQSWLILLVTTAACEHQSCLRTPVFQLPANTSLDSVCLSQQLPANTSHACEHQSFTLVSNQVHVPFSLVWFLCVFGLKPYASRFLDWLEVYRPRQHSATYFTLHHVNPPQHSCWISFSLFSFFLVKFFFGLFVFLFLAG